MADRGIRAVKAQIIFFYDPDTVGRRECGADQILEKGFIGKVKITTAGGDQVALYIQLQCKIRQADILLHFVGQMEKEGIAASVIGKTTDNNDRVVVNGEERRFLEMPKPDELYKVFG